MKKPGKATYYFYLISLAVIVLDQTIKFFLKSTETGKDIFNIGFFSFTHVHNYGAGISILQGQNWLFISIAIAFIFLVIIFYEKIEKSIWVQTGFALLLGGTTSNLIDRISLGYVIDFFDFKIWPVFNIADSAISTGAAILIIYYLIKEKEKKKKKR